MQVRPRETTIGPASPFGAFLNYDPVPTRLDMDMHGTFEVGVLLSGREEWYFPDLMRIVQPGDVHLSAPWEPHGWRVLEPESLGLHWEFLPEGLGEVEIAGHPWPTLFALDPRDRPAARTPRMREEALAIARLVRQEIEEQRPAWQEACRLYLLQLLLVVAREWELPSDYHPERRVHPSDLERIMPALQLVERSVGRRVSQEEGAATCALSVSRFGRVFRHATGVSFGQFSLRARLARAARLLLHTSLSVEAISGEAGFLDGSHLARVFAKHYGVPPAEYRERGRE